jgi:hypothetical protein
VQRVPPARSKKQDSVTGICPWTLELALSTWKSQTNPKDNNMVTPLKSETKKTKNFEQKSN